MFTNWRRSLFVSINAFVEVAASVTNISCIAQVTLKFINYTLLVNSGWLDFSNFKVFVEFSADEHGLNGRVLIFELRSVRRFFTTLAETWSLNGMITFIGQVELLNLATRIKTKVYVKPTNSGLLLHYQSHVDIRYKRSLITTMLDSAYCISSDWSYFSQECDRLEIVFLKLKYPKHLFNLAVKEFVDSKVADQQHIPSTDTTTPPIRVISHTI